MESLGRSLHAIPGWLRTCAAGAFGLSMVAFTPSHVWDGLPAGPMATILGVVMSGIALLLGARVPWPFALWLFVASSLSLAGSYAVGSSWAFMTWMPLVTASLLLGRLSKAFTIGALGYVILRDATTLVVLDQVFAAGGFSGSVQYHVGFAAAALTPLLLGVVGTRRRIALTSPRAWAAAAVVAIALGLAFWATLASGSRSAIVAAVLGLLFVFGVAASRTHARANLRMAILLVLVGGMLIVPIDAAMTRAFGSGDPLAVRTLLDGIRDSVSELRRYVPTRSAIESNDGGAAAPSEPDSAGWTVRPGSLATRLALWRQAGTMLIAVPIGHGPASYAHVNHAYQREPLLWSGSPHSIWALGGVETGALGLAALALLVTNGLRRAASRGSVTAGALVAATIVMSFDVFASMPAASLLWWAVVGSAWGASERHRRSSGVIAARNIASTGVVIAVLAVGPWLSLRLAKTCDQSCDPVALFGGNPRLVGSPVAILSEDPSGGTWRDWRAKYPLAFWLAEARAITEGRATSQGEDAVTLLRDYPFQSAERYLTAATAAEDPAVARALAGCGLERFFDGRAIWRDWRSSTETLANVERGLEELAGDPLRLGDACSNAHLPSSPIGLR